MAVKVIYYTTYQRSSSIEGHLPSKVVFCQRSYSVKCRLPSKVVFRQRLSSAKGNNRLVLGRTLVPPMSPSPYGGDRSPHAKICTANPGPIIGSKKYFGSKRFWGKKILGPENLRSNILSNSILSTRIRS